jgi:2-aminoadipate transaminase
MAGDLAHRARELGDFALREEIEIASRGSGVISLGGERPSADLFDSAGISEALNRALGGISDPSYLQADLDADPQLSEQLASLAQSRGLDCEPDNIVVTAGSQQTLDLLISALVDPGDTVLVERPCSPTAIELFTLAGASVIQVDCDAGGLVVDSLEQAVSDYAPKLLYTTPNFQNPTGTTLDEERRAQIASLAQREAVWVIEDDSYGGLRYQGAPLKPLASHEPHRFASRDPQRVIYMSTLSHLVAPGLRIGFIVCSHDLHHALTRVKGARDMRASALEQRAASLYVSADEFSSHLDRLRSACAKRLEAMVELLPDTLPNDARWVSPEGGMFVWVELAPGTDTLALMRQATDNGVTFMPGALFYVEGGYHNTLRLSFASLPPDDIAEGLRRLKRVFQPPRQEKRQTTTRTKQPSRTTVTRSLSNFSGVTSSVSSNFGGTRSVTVPRRYRTH